MVGKGCTASILFCCLPNIVMFFMSHISRACLAFATALEVVDGPHQDLGAMGGSTTDTKACTDALLVSLLSMNAV